MKNTFDIIELFLDPEQGLDGVGAMSIVSDPAMEGEFFAFNKDAEFHFKTIDTEKKTIMGAALIPNKMILRKFKDTMAYVYFSPDTIRETMELYFQNGNQNNTTLEHMIQLDNLTVVESWIVEDEVHDKSVKYGFNYPNGTWMLSMKVNDDTVWNEIIKTGMVKGFSIEGRYSKGNPNLSKDVQLFNTITKLIENITEV